MSMELVRARTREHRDSRGLNRIRLVWQSFRPAKIIARAHPIEYAPGIFLLRRSHEGIALFPWCFSWKERRRRENDVFPLISYGLSKIRLSVKKTWKRGKIIDLYFFSGTNMDLEQFVHLRWVVKKLLIKM